MSDPVAVKHMLGNRTQIPDDAQPGHANQEVIGHVDFPPEKTLAGGNGIVVMVVVPAFSESQKRGEHVVAALVGGVESLLTPHVGQRVDQKGIVPEQNGAQEKTDE